MREILYKIKRHYIIIKNGVRGEISMKSSITFKNLLHIIISSIDYMDGSLAGHCTRVAYDIMSI